MTTKRKLTEFTAPQGASGELDKAKIILATKSISDAISGMIEDLAKIDPEELLPLVDQMKVSFGPEVAQQFNQESTQALETALEAVKVTKDAFGTLVARLEGVLSGEPFGADMAGDDAAIEPEAPAAPGSMGAEPDAMAAPAPEAAPMDDGSGGMPAQPMGRSERMIEALTEQVIRGMLRSLHEEKSTYMTQVMAKKSGVKDVRPDDEIIVDDPDDPTHTKVKAAKIVEDTAPIALTTEQVRILSEHLREVLRHDLRARLPITEAAAIDSRVKRATLFVPAPDGHLVFENLLLKAATEKAMSRGRIDRGYLDLEEALSSDLVAYIRSQIPFQFMRGSKTKIVMETKTVTRLVNLLETLAVTYKIPTRVRMLEIRPARPLKPFSVLTMIDEGHSKTVFFKKLGAHDISEALVFAKGKRPHIRVDQSPRKFKANLVETVLAVYDHRGCVVKKLTEKVRDLMAAGVWSATELRLLEERTPVQSEINPYDPGLPLNDFGQIKGEPMSTDYGMYDSETSIPTATAGQQGETEGDINSDQGQGPDDSDQADKFAANKFKKSEPKDESKPKADKPEKDDKADKADNPGFKKFEKKEEVTESRKRK